MGLSEFAEVGGFVLALQVIVLGPLVARVWRHRKQLNEIQGKLARAERLGALVSTSVTRGLLGIDNTLDWSAGILHRLVLKRDGEVSGEKMIEQLRDQRFALERAVAEVRLLAGSGVEQESALQQLTYRLGDSRTVATFGEAADLDGFANVSRGSLRAAQRELVERLTHRNHTARNSGR
jgi:heme exporter protein D